MIDTCFALGRFANQSSTDYISSDYQVGMRRLPPLSAVRVFEAAARHQNFTRAAAELGMTQAAVSYKIKLLEEWLGLALFIRSKRRVTLSETGHRAAPLIASALDTIGRTFSDLLVEDAAVLTISTSQAMASNWLTPRLESFRIGRPDLVLSLRTDIEPGDFEREDVDIGIHSGVDRSAWPGLKADFLFRLHSTPMCTPDFRHRHGIREPADLLRVPRLNPDADWWHRWFDAAGLCRSERAETGSVHLDSQAMEGNAALAGLGVGMLTPFLWRPELASGRLVQPFPLVICEAPSYWLLYPEHRRRQPKLAAFRECLLRELRADMASESPEILISPA